MTVKTGTVYATRTVGTASGAMHTKREIGYVGAERTYLGEGIGEWLVSTPTTHGVACIVFLGPDGYDVYDGDVNDWSSNSIARGLATGREAIGKALGVTSFRVDGE